MNNNSLLIVIFTIILVISIIIVITPKLPKSLEIDKLPIKNYAELNINSDNYSYAFVSIYPDTNILFGNDTIKVIYVPIGTNRSSWGIFKKVNNNNNNQYYYLESVIITKSISNKYWFKNEIILRNKNY